MSSLSQDDFLCSLSNSWRMAGFLALIFIMPTCHAAPLPAPAPVTATISSAPIDNILSSTYDFKALGWDSSITLNGYQPDYTLYFPTSNQQKIQSAILHLKLAFSKTLSAQTSIVIKFNQSFIKQIIIPPVTDSESEWDIQLPVTQFAGDWQSISFSAYLVSEKDLCDPDVWIYISPDTRLTINYQLLPFQGTLNQLPLPFINPSAINPVPTTLVLPQAPSSQEVLALFQIAKHLGEIVNDARVKLSSTTMEQLTNEQEKTNHLIFIGVATELFKTPHYLWDGFNANNAVKSALYNRSGIIMLTQSALNPMLGLLVITGSTQAALEQAVSAFITPEFPKLAAEQLAVINRISIHPKRPESLPWYRKTFKNLGYDNQSVSGLGYHKISYKIRLPNDRIPGRGLLKTYITAPLFPGQHQSQITLLVNGQKQASTWINQEQTAWQTEINASLLKPGENSIEYRMELHHEHEQCTRENYNETWAVIQSASYFEMNFQDGTPRAALNQLPVPFGNEISIIVPESLSNKMINSLTDFFFTTGRLFNSPLPLIHIKTANTVDEAYIRNHSLILIGTPNNNVWVKFALDFLPVKLKEQSRIFNSLTKSIQISSTTSTGLLELIQSPWSENNTLLLIGGNSEEALGKALQSISNDKLRATFNGNIALINPDESIAVISSHGNRYLSPGHRLTQYLYNIYRNVRYNLTMHPQSIIYALAFIVPLLILFRRKKK